MDELNIPSMIAGFETLMDLAEWVKWTSGVDLDASRNVIVSICSMMETIFVKPDADLSVLHSAFECILHWLSASQELLEDAGMYRMVMKTLESALQYHQAHPSEVHMGEQRAVFGRLFARSHPSQTNLTVIHPSREYDLLKWELKIYLRRFMDLMSHVQENTSNVALNDLQQLRMLIGGQHGVESLEQGIRFILVDHRMVVSYLEHPSSSGSVDDDEEITLVIRDAMGKHVRPMRLRVASDEFMQQRRQVQATLDENRKATAAEAELAANTQPSRPRTSSSSNILTVKAANEHCIPSPEQMFTENKDSTRIAELVDQLVSAQAERERIYADHLTAERLRSMHVYPPMATDVPKPVRIFRQFAAEIGYLRNENRGDVAVLQFTTKLLDMLEDFDRIST
jgi:hypothetical protein